MVISKHLIPGFSNKLDYLYLLTFGVSDVCTFHAGDRCADSFFLHKTIHCVGHLAVGDVFIVKVADRDGVTQHLSHRHWNGFDQGAAIFPCNIPAIVLITWQNVLQLLALRPLNDLILRNTVKQKMGTIFTCPDLFSNFIYSPKSGAVALCDIPVSILPWTQKNRL